MAVSIESLVCKKVTLYGLEQTTIDEILKQAQKVKLSPEDQTILNECVSRLKTTSMGESQYKLFHRFLIDRLDIYLT